MLCLGTYIQYITIWGEVKMATNYATILKRYYSKIISNYDVEIESTIPQLFPTILTESEKTYEYKKDCPLTDFIQSTWDEPVRKNIVLLGDGGAGKTTNMLAAYTDLVKKGINCAFIPLLFIEGIDNANIESYFLDNIFRKKDDYDDFLESIETEGRTFGKPSFVLFLDGYNEVYLSKNLLYVDLRKWLSLAGIQIIISTRESLNDIAYLKNRTIEFARLKTLDKKRVTSYLKEINSTFKPEQFAPFLYGNPMMLTLYASVHNYISRFSSSPMLVFRPDCNPGSILWNYMQLQILKYNELLRGTAAFGYEQCNLLAIINCILPYIGWVLEKKQRMIISYEEFGSLVSEAVKNNIITCEQKIIECCYDNGIYEWDCEENQIKKIILEKLGFFKKNSNMIQFRHQNYRDFFAAYYYYTNLFESDNPLSKHIWGTTPISFDSIKIFCDLISDEQIEKLTKICNYNDSDEESYSVDNLFQVYNIIYKGDLSKVSFSDLDLRNIFLNQYKFADPNNNASFARCLFSTSSFYGDGHHGRVITAEYSPDKTYIASSCTAGEIKVWRSGSGKKILEIKENSSIYALCWINNRSFIFGTITGECYTFDILENQKVKLFDTFSSGIKSITYIDNRLYVGCVNGDFWRGSLNDINAKLSIHISIIKILVVDDGVLLLDSQGNLYVCLNNENLCHQVAIPNNQITDICCFKDGIIACTVRGDIFQWSQSELFEKHDYNQAQLLLQSPFRFTSIEQVDNRLVCGTQSGEIVLYDFDDDYIIFPIEHIGWIRTISFSSEAHELVTGGSDGKIILWDMHSLTKKTEKCGIPNMVLCHDYIQKSNLLVSSSNDCKVIVWNVDSQIKIAEFVKHTDWVRCVATGNNSDIFASGGTDGVVNVWTIHDREKMRVTNECILREKAWVMSLDWNRTDTMLLAGMRNGKVYCWKRGLKSYEGNILYSHKSPVHCVRFSPSGKYIASSDQDGNIYIFDNGNLHMERISNEPVRHVRWSKDEQKMFACCLDGNIIEYQFENEECKLKELRRIDSHGARCIDYKDEYLMFAGTDFGLWETNFIDSILIDQLHFDNIDYIAHNNRFLSTSAHDGNVVVREIDGLNEYSVLKLIPIINICGCKFDSCVYENQELNDILKMNGGILKSAARL